MNQLNPFLIKNIWIFLPIMLWTLFWKGSALWIASKRDERWWFLALLVINTIGILEIVYIFYVTKKKWVDVKEIFSKPTSAPTAAK